MFVAGRYTESLSSLRKSPPDNPVTLMFRALCHASLGEMTQAQTIANLIAVKFPRFTVENFIQTYPCQIRRLSLQSRKALVWLGIRRWQVGIGS